MTNAFITYSSKDESLAMQLHRALRMAGIETFMAAKSIEAGEDWSDEIFTNLKKANWVFFIAKKNACKSHAVQQELGASLIENKIIIPILINIEPEELPGWVNKHQAIDIRKTPDMLHATIEQISEKIKIDRFWAGVILGALLVFFVLAFKE